MSTPNFYNKNASKIFAVSEEFDEETQECISENWRDAKDNIASELESKGYREVSISDNDRNYPGEYFLEKELVFWDLWRITIYAVVRGAYYSGTNFDWQVDVIKDRDEDYEEGDLCDIPVPMTVQAAIDREIKRIEKAFELYTDKLNCVGIFSNGEAIYEHAK